MTIKTTPKQTEVLFWVQKGLTNKQIADRLNLTESTIKAHMKGLLKIYEVKNRQHLALYSLGNTVSVMPTIEEIAFAWGKKMTILISFLAFSGFIAWLAIIYIIVTIYLESK